MASTRGPGCAKSLLLWAFARVAFAPTAYPHLGIHTGEDRTNARPPNALPLLRPPGGFLAHHGSGALLVTGENRLSWPVGCCEGDLIVIDFRDEQADGNDGSGMLYLNNTYVQSYRIQCAALCPRPCRHYLTPRISASTLSVSRSQGPARVHVEELRAILCARGLAQLHVHERRQPRGDGLHHHGLVRPDQGSGRNARSAGKVLHLCPEQVLRA